jgi:uncharacterized SAM-binding protein YcdF (DUF218 family)
LKYFSTRKSIGKRLQRVAFLVFAGLGLLFSLVSFTPVVPWYARWLAGPWDDPQGDRLVVLGGATLGEGILGYSTYWRAVYAVRFHRLRNFRQIVVTPGKTVLLTSDYHMFRAHRIFRKRGIAVLPMPIPDIVKRGNAWDQRWPAFIEELEETGKIVYYFLRGWI